MKNFLIITRGLPASGKSTFSKAWVEEDSNNRIRVNKDDIRGMFSGPYDKEKERFVRVTEQSIAKSALQKGLNVIVDDTNLRESDLELWKTLTEIECKCDFFVKDFRDVDLETCIERDSKREGNTHVGENTIRKMFNRFIKERE